MTTKEYRKSFGEKTRRKAFKKSLGDWMIENLGEDAIENYWSDNNTFSPFEIGCGSSYEIFIKCINTDYHGDFPIVANSAKLTMCRCPYCSKRKIHPKDSFAQWIINSYGESFFETVWSKNNTLNPWELGLSGKEHILVVCEEVDYHGEYPIRVEHFVNGSRCPYCTSHKTHPNDSLGTHLIESFGENGLDLRWSSLNTRSPFNISIKSNNYYWWKCPNGIHKDFKRKGGNSKKSNYNCPSCVHERNESFLQEKVRIYLNHVLQLKTFHEYNCKLTLKNPITDRGLRYDNEVFVKDSKLIIEVHGEQHYMITGFTKRGANRKSISPEEELIYIQWKDQYKKEYALSQGYYYLEIPYWTDNDDEEWKQLIDNKINEIIHKEKGLIKWQIQ